MYVIQTNPAGHRERIYVEHPAPVHIALDLPNVEKIEFTHRSGVKWTYERSE